MIQSERKYIAADATVKLYTNKTEEFIILGKTCAVDIATIHGVVVYSHDPAVLVGTISYYIASEFNEFNGEVTIKHSIG